MPQRTPLMAVTGSTLVLADPTSTPASASAPAPVRPSPARTRGPYARLFALPGTRGFTAGNLLARLPMGMFGISAVMMIAGQRGSYALAGAVTATGLAATAVVAPWTARLVDRHGQARIAVPATVIAVLGSLCLVICVRTGAPAWTLFASYAATATTPNIGGLSRARWTHLLPREAHHTAMSFEQAADELCYLLGPVLAALLCTSVFPEAGTLTGAALLLTGMLVFTAHRATEPPPAGRRSVGGPSPVRALLPLLALFLATGVVFGSMEVTSVAHLAGLGLGAASGPVLALQAAGSCAAGLLYGTLRPRSLRACLGALAGAMALPWAAAATGSLPLLAGALLLAGTAPVMVTAMSRVQALTPEGRLNEGMTLAVTAILAGIAVGSAAAGLAVDRLGTTTAYALPAMAALFALFVRRPSDRTRVVLTTGAHDPQ
ncbi:MFS transporter [Streptomyces lavendulae]|uniref:MFS transporter n=1 Tax=Streptomyces lavendulae TaxID=1914 RepID=UPI0024A042B9|nr:MFS transporter [Streptomyces lavendulae]GLW00339.1 transporter [Streptomyces lavendulae subsp. lavendulae]